MKITTVAALAIAVAMNARATEVTVYVQGLPVVPLPVLNRAQVLANGMFAGVDVRIDWRAGQPPRRQSQHQGAILVEIVTDTPRELLPGALAFARPFEGVRINVFYDRVRAATEPELTPNVLAHVLVHEITHILEGTCRHSDTGIMKARWNRVDYARMSLQSLPFTEEDVLLIRFGLAERARAGSLIAAAPPRGD
jgi:hypothetical protein